MKKLMVFVLALTAVLAVSCTGSTGPMGPEGPPGLDGDGVIGQTFEFDGVNFDYEPGYNLWATIVDIPNDIEVFDSDAILVFRIESDGDADTFSMIPQSFYLDDGEISYVYNHTAGDVELLIDGNFDLSNLDPGFTDNQIFRFVVVPSDFANDPNVHINKYSDLLEYGVELDNVSL